MLRNSASGPEIGPPARKPDFRPEPLLHNIEHIPKRTWPEVGAVVLDPVDLVQGHCIGSWGRESFMDPPNREVVFRVRVVGDVRAKL